MPAVAELELVAERDVVLAQDEFVVRIEEIEVAVGLGAAFDQQAHGRQDRERHAQAAGVQLGEVVVDVAELVEFQNAAAGARADLELGALGGGQRRSSLPAHTPS